MNRLKSLYLCTICAIFVIGISSGGASAQQASWEQNFSSEANPYYGGSFIKVGHKGRRNTAIAIGAIVLGTMLYNQNQKRNYQGNYSGNAHVNWCYNRYRSYRAYDNTFQPYRGRRRQCISPYY
jgi:hypothetical protein